MVQPHLRIGRDDPHPIALLPGDPDRVGRIADRCDAATDLARNREYRVVNARTGGTPVTICSTGIGSPSAAVAVEELAACGVETFIRVGTCGALQPGLRRGDAVIATAAAKAAGTTRRYEADTVPATAAHAVVRALVDAVRDGDGYRDATDRAGIPSEGDRAPAAHLGPIATDDAFYAETEDYVAAWSEAGLLAVEMEAAAVFALARRHGGRAGAICTADGNLVAGTKKGDTDDTDGNDELPDAAREGVGRSIDAALDAVGRL
jgi:uridine phosphorylase